MLLHFLFTQLVICTVSGRFNPPEVNTPLGKITGKFVFFDKTEVKTFQSIPFAKPPIGNLRFKRPQPVEPWSQPLKADSLPPGCVQYVEEPFPLVDNLPGKTQDCLYLNIWAPSADWSNEKKAVMFWIYGGGFKVGSSRLDHYDGVALAALGDVIVVTSNYRLSTEGFLYSGTEEAPGNMGLYDILEALKWVKSNIKYFGGDEDNITLFGQSAGAITIGMFMYSPLARGLFARVIMQSGSPTNMAAENNEKDFELSQKIAAAVGCANDANSLKDNPDKVVRCLKEKSASTLVEAEGKISVHSLRGYYPRFGDAILPSNVRKAFIEGKFEGVDTLIGVNHNEGAFTISRSYREFFGFYGEKNHQINKTFGEYIIRDQFKSFPNPNAVVKHYLGKLREDDYERILYQVQTSSADFTRVCPSIYQAERVAKKGNKVLFYFFIHRPSVTPWAPWMGVVHSDETPFVFGYPLRYPSKYTEKEKLLSTQMIEAWTSFAKYGSKPLLKLWPLYSRKQHRYFALDTNRERTAIGPDLENCDFFRPYFGF